MFLVFKICLFLYYYRSFQTSINKKLQSKYETQPSSIPCWDSKTYHSIMSLHLDQGSRPLKLYLFVLFKVNPPFVLTNSLSPSLSSFLSLLHIAAELRLPPIESTCCFISRARCYKTFPLRLMPQWASLYYYAWFYGK